MKKILTLLVMTLMSWGILLAQTTTPKISYQAVVRHHDAENDMDTLYHDQTVDVTINVGKEGELWYTETHTGVPTNENGFLSILIGEGENQEGSLLDVDWSDNAVIFASIDLEPDSYRDDPLEIIMPVTAVPYAIQASIGPLTTEMIAHYSKYTITDEGMTQILDAIRDNPNGLKDGLKQWVIDYMKEHKEIAKEIVEEYLAHFDDQNVREAYEALSTNPRRQQLRNLLKELLIANRPMAKELALWFVTTADAYDIERTYETLMDVSSATKQAAWNRLVNYVTNPDNRVVVYDLGVYFVQNVITSQDATNAYNTLKTLNPAVKNDLRDKVDYWVYQYLNDPDHPERQAYLNVGNDAVDNAIDRYVEEHPRIPVPANCDVDICNMKEKYDQIVEP